jgi:hypothetical protein
MTVRKIIELIDFIKSKIGADFFLTKIQDYIVTIQNNANNLVLLKEINEKAISDYESIVESEIPDLLEKILVNKLKPFTRDAYYQRLIDLKGQNHTDPNTLYSQLNSLLTNIQSLTNNNIAELDKIAQTVRPYLSKDYTTLQQDNNAIFAIVFANENTYNNLKLLSFELKNWDRALFIYQQIVSDETPKSFEIVEVDQGSIEVVINLLFEVGTNLLDLFKTGLEVYAAYLAYKTIVHDQLAKTFNGNEELIKLEETREKLLLENVRNAVKRELQKQAKQTKKHEALEKKIDEVTKLVTEHIIKGNSVKLLSAPADKTEEIIEKEQSKESTYIKAKADYKKIDDTTKQLLIDQFTTQPPTEQYEKE